MTASHNHSETSMVNRMNEAGKKFLNSLSSSQKEKACFEYLDGSGRVPEETAVGIITNGALILFGDIRYSDYDHDYWDNYELEFDVDRVVLP